MYILFDDVSLPTDDPRGLVGTEYLDYDHTPCTVTGVASRDLYGVRKQSSPFLYLLPAEHLLRLLEQQPRLQRESDRRRELERQEAERAERERQEYERDWGFTATMPPHQRGKALKTLNRHLRLPDGRVLSRKDMIHEFLSRGCTLETAGPRDYRLYTPDGTFYAITKTEYELGQYLLARGIVQTSPQKEATA